jgi:hypothetical protein
MWFFFEYDKPFSEPTNKLFIIISGFAGSLEGSCILSFLTIS